MNNELNEQINDIQDEYVIITKNRNNILDDMDFKNEEERILCESIITNLEQEIASGIKVMKACQIPFIGCIRINPINKKIKNNGREFRAIREQLTTEEYKEHVKEFINNAKKEQQKIDTEKKNLYKLKRKFKKKYDELYLKNGKSYAELFIFSLSCFKEVPFDREWEEQYQKLSRLK